ncbi:MAG: uracil-DNA glycosylase [Hyphomicrobiaceae bacterium]
MVSTSSQPPLVRLIAWYGAMGVDGVVSEEATDWLARGNRPPMGFSVPDPRAPGTVPPPALVSRPPPISPPPPARRFPTAAPDEAVTTARALAARAGSLDELGAALAGFEGCGLKATAKNLCFFRGSPNAPLMIIGEAPGRDEDLEGRPFVGAAGRLLDKMLAAIGLTEADVHITNTVYWRPPGNRVPTPQEAQVCRPFLERQIDLLNPKLILTLGGPAIKNLCNLDGIMKVRGTWRTYTAGNREVPVLPTLHPAYLLRSPLAKRLAWRDFLTVKIKLSE